MIAKVQLKDGEGQVEEVKMSASYKELTGFDGLEWNISQDSYHCRFFKRFRIIFKIGTLNLKNSQTGSSSCQCSTTSIGQEKETMEFVFRIQKKSRNTRKDGKEK